MVTNPPTDEMRAAFEKWAVANDCYMDVRRDGNYASTATSGAWEGFKAALSHQGAVVAVDALQGLCDEWENMKVPHSASSYELGMFDGYRGAHSDLTDLISKAEKV